MHLAPPFGEFLRDEIGGALLLEPDLGMGVDVAADPGQLVEMVTQLGDNRHGSSGTGWCHHTGSPPPRPPSTLTWLHGGWRRPEEWVSRRSARPATLTRGTGRATRNPLRAQPRLKPSISCAAQSIAWSTVLPPWVHWAIILAIVACA